MQILLLPFFFGLAVNVANAHPHSAADANAALLSQFTSPVVVADYSTLNK